MSDQKQAKMEKRHVVSVYGTLRRNLYNSYLMQTAEFIAEGWSVDNATMYSRGGFPILSFHKGERPVKVELYYVDDATLSRLDSLEGYRGEGLDNWYSRSVKDFSFEEEPGSLRTISAMIYHQDGEHELPVVESGDWATARQRVI